ncbi:unnamed protein product [Clonostachys solani]|uniref:peptidyl-tRNA hydrolase n=1 Tax=Clonostachys solani TaxID=160281 RepID=A0A9N9W9P1_9HYPO|nr:unnamed protein product [Clonostachys solani]
MFNPRFLVVSLGNPLPKYASLHSAGHFALRGLAPIIQHPDFREVRMGKQTALVSQGPKYTLVQSPTLMNISGPFIAGAWNEMLKQHDASSLSLVIVHDEMEKGLGIVKLTAWDRSHKGHNGIKSIKAHLSEDKFPESPFVRIALGIGRPKSREPQDVSDYVLQPILPEKRQILEEEVPWEVAKCLKILEKEWKQELGR